MSERIVGYKPLHRAFHWLVALLVLATIPVGVTMVSEDISRSVQDALFIFHKNVGVVILLLMLARLAYRLVNPPPPLPDSVPRWQASVAHATHWLLYLLVFVMAISGYIRVVAGGFPLEVFDAIGVPRLAPRSDELAETAKGIHFYVRFALVVLILMHVGAALFHAIVKRDGVFSSMVTGRPRA
ncbi:cytochrome b [Mesorhizobium sp. CAU 1741]|uniref:cytochrome b n=1 Tax=Mesorhizobium sp. CAU 1741 TaxID=3140366 RepID=UPI00325AE09E